MAQPNGTELLSFAEAAELALTESDEATSDDSDTALPAEDETQLEVDGQADADDSEEQPETDGETEASDDADEDESKDESLFGDLDDDDEGADAPDAVAVIAAELGIEASTVEDLQESLRELKEAGLRLSDYTKKTQKLADDRRAWEAEASESKRLYDALRSDPVGFFSALAREVGVDVEVQGARNPDFKLTGQDDIEKMVEERLAERLETDPDIKQARQAAAIKAVDDAFASIEQAHSVTLAVPDRQKMLRYAADKGITDLDVVFEVFQARAAKARAAKAERAEQAKQTSTKRSQGRVPESSVLSKPASVEEALNRALAAQGA